MGAAVGDLKAAAPVREISSHALRLKVPLWLLGFACAAALLHGFPFWRAFVQTPPGWAFTGNIHRSPDFMQYRAWFRQTQQTGVLVRSKFTAEPHPPHLPVVLYYATARLAAHTGVSPEVAFIFIGGVLAFIFTIALFVTVRLFLPHSRQAVWVFLIIFFGGGLGGLMKLLGRFDFVQQNFFLKTLLIDPMVRTLVFEDYRGHYVFSLFGDTHHLLNWLVMMLAAVSLYAALRRTSPWRVAAMAFLFAAAPLLHVYSGVTLLAITAGVTLLCKQKGLLDRAQAAVPLMAGAAAMAALTFLWVLNRIGGLPVTDWRPQYILPSIVLIAYPLAWLLIGWGIGRYWRHAGLKECFLLGWALGCTALLLAGPFYPFPDRGASTLQIPLYLIAGAIYFSHYLPQRPRRRAAHALLAIVLVGVTPVWAMAKRWTWTAFRADAPYMWLSPAHREIIERLRQSAAQTDILLVDDDHALWLAPEYPGVLYCGHFFLTVDYERKRALMRKFEAASPNEKADFLRRQRIRHLFLAPGKELSAFAQTPGLRLLVSNAAGTLWEWQGSHAQ